MNFIIYKAHRRYILFEWREFPKLKPKDNALVMVCNNNQPYCPQWMAVYHSYPPPVIKGMETVIPYEKYSSRNKSGDFNCGKSELGPARIRTCPEITHWFPIIDGPPPKRRLGRMSLAHATRMSTLRRFNTGRLVRKRKDRPATLSMRALDQKLAEKMQ